MNKSARELLNDMETLQDALRKVCPHCQQDTLTFITAESCHCVNPECPGYYVTREVEVFLTLTPAELEQFSGCKTSLKTLQAGQEAHDANMDRIMAELAERQAARKAMQTPGTKLFG
jgi:hypothetical protein